MAVQQTQVLPAPFIEAHDQSFLVANSGGLANLFRVKNNQ